MTSKKAKGQMVLDEDGNVKNVPVDDENPIVENGSDEDDLFSVPTYLDPGTYLIKFVDAYKKEWPGENKFNPDKPNVTIQWAFEFALIDDDGDVIPMVNSTTGGPLTWEFSTSTSFSERSTAFKWATTFLRRPVKRDEVSKLKSLLKNRKAVVVIGQKDNGYPKIVEMSPHLGR